MNLATNARDTMPEGGTLRISTDITTFDQEFIKKYGYGTPGIYVSMIVEDTGYGMDEKVKSRIFEPFFTTKEAGKGTGLGLAMVYGIIKQHEGYINVYSEPGSGTTFKIYLPLIASGKDERKEIATSALKGGTETVLLAEDDVLVRNLLTEVLDGVGYRVISAVDGEDAIRKYNEHKEEIKLLILDVIMPKKNGKEVYETIKQQRPNIKTLFTSGYSADIIQKKRILEEGLALLLKPIIPDDIVRKVRELLDTKSLREDD
jgi:two-component system, cell cycle sensor histidine kinase and response regulator CckA